MAIRQISTELIESQAVTPDKLHNTLDLSSKTITMASLELSGSLNGPAVFTIDPAAHADNTGTVVIAGNLQVDGTTTTINSTTMTVDDLNITLASGAANSAAANGAGIVVDISGATNPSLTYDSTNDEWDFNKNVNVTGTISSAALGVNTAPNANYAIYALQNGSLTRAAYLVANGGTGTGLEINATAGTYTGDALYVRQSSSSTGGNLARFANSTDDKFIVTTAGNVGIGASSPETLLHVEKSSSALYTSSMSGVPSYTPSGGDMIQVRNSNTGVDDIYAGIWFETGNGATNTTGTDRSGRIALVVDNDSPYSSNFVFQTRGSAGTLTEKMRITNDGNVGIGTDSPTLAMLQFGINATANRLAIKTASDRANGIGLASYTTITTRYSNWDTLIGTNVRSQIGTSSSGEQMASSYTASGAAGLRIGFQDLEFKNYHPTELSGLTEGDDVTSLGTTRLLIDSGGRVGINQTPLGNNFALQVTGLGGAIGDARAVYLKGSGAHTTIGGTGPTLVLQNTNSTANNIVKLSFESASAGETISINAINTNHSSHYGDMAFNTRGSSGYSEKMRIMANGNVGIGVQNPNKKLEVAGDIQLDATDANIWLKSGATGTNGFINWTFNTDNTVFNKIGMDYDTRASTGFHIDAGYPITVDATASGGKAINFAISGNTKAVLDGSGNVGIGTDDPDCALDVTRTTGWAEMHLDGASGGDLILKDNGVSYGEIYAGNGHGFVLKSYAGQDMYFLTNAEATVKMVIEDGGNVGIGEDQPTYKLDVLHSSTPIAQFKGATNAYFDLNDGSINTRFQNSGGFYLGTTTNHDIHFKANNQTKLSINTSGAVTTESQGQLIGNKWINNHENIYWNSKLISSSGHGNAPDKWYTQGAVTITSEHPYNKGFSTQYTNTQSASHTTNINNATPSTPYWGGVYTTFPGATNFSGPQNSSIGGGWENGEGAIMKMVYDGSGSVSSTNAVRANIWKNFFSAGALELRMSFFYFIESGQFSSGYFAGYNGYVGNTNQNFDIPSERHLFTNLQSWTYINHASQSYLGATYQQSSQNYMNGFGFTPGIASVVWIAIPALTTVMRNDGKTHNIHSATQQIGQG